MLERVTLSAQSRKSTLDPLVLWQYFIYWPSWFTQFDSFMKILLSVQPWFLSLVPSVGWFVSSPHCPVYKLKPYILLCWSLEMISMGRNWGLMSSGGSHHDLVCIIILHCKNRWRADTGQGCSQKNTVRRWLLQDCVGTLPIRTWVLRIFWPSERWQISVCYSTTLSTVLAFGSPNWLRLCRISMRVKVACLKSCSL